MTSPGMACGPLQVVMLLLSCLQCTSQTISIVSRGALCAMIDSQQSTAWKDSATDENHFSLRLSAVKLVESLVIKVEWDQMVWIDHVYEADIVDGGGEESVLLLPEHGGVPLLKIKQVPVRLRCRRGHICHR